MFQTDTAKDTIQKLLSINHGWRDEPYLLPKAYLSCKICSRRRIFSDQDVLVIGKYLLDQFFNEDPKHTHDIAYFRNVFSRCPTIGYFLNLYAPDIVVDIKALRDIRKDILADDVSLILNILVILTISKNRDVSLRSEENDFFELYQEETKLFPKSIITLTLCCLIFDSVSSDFICDSAVSNSAVLEAVSLVDSLAVYSSSRLSCSNLTKSPIPFILS